MKKIILISVRLAKLLLQNKFQNRSRTLLLNGRKVAKYKPKH